MISYFKYWKAKRFVVLRGCRQAIVLVQPLVMVWNFFVACWVTILLGKWNLKLSTGQEDPTSPQSRVYSGFPVSTSAVLLYVRNRKNPGSLFVFSTTFFFFILWKVLINASIIKSQLFGSMLMNIIVQFKSYWFSCELTVLCSKF